MTGATRNMEPLRWLDDDELVTGIDVVRASHKRQGPETPRWERWAPGMLLECFAADMTIPETARETGWDEREVVELRNYMLKVLEKSPRGNKGGA